MIETVMSKDPVKAEADRKKMSETLKKVKGTPQARKKQSNAMKKYYEDPEARKKTSETLKKVKGTPQARKKQSDAMKKYFEDPEARKKTSETLKKVKGTPQARKKQSDAMKKYFEDPETRKKRSEVLKKSQGTPEARQKYSEVHKKRYVDQQWYGSVKYYDGPQYCEKWTNELKERVRAWFDHCCIECGAPQNGMKLSVHHVWYNKKACCDDTPRSLVPLCSSCHIKTNVNRDYWSNHFQEIIDTYYGGRCWMSREEFSEFKKKKL